VTAATTTSLGECHLHAGLDARRPDDLDRLAAQVDGRGLLARDDGEHVDALEATVDLRAKDLADLGPRGNERFDERATGLARAGSSPGEPTVVELARELDLDAARHAQKLAGSLRSS
jgi:hypothetical protein